MINTNKVKKDFFLKCLSKEGCNVQYNNEQIIAYLVGQAVNNQSLETVSGISPDAIQRRLDLGEGYDFGWLESYNTLALGLVPMITVRNRRVRWNLIIDDSQEPFFGDIDKMKIFLDANELPDFLTSHITTRGSTGSFEYCVVALSSKIGTFPILVIPKIVKADLIPILGAVLEEVNRKIPNVTVLADRWFGNQHIIRLCQKLKINYCIRLKKKGKLKKIKKNGRHFFWHNFDDVKFRVVMHKSHGKEL